MPKIKPVRAQFRRGDSVCLLGQFKPDPASWFGVSGVRDGNVECYPYGGGYIRSVPKEKLQLLPPNAEANLTWKHRLFTMDGLPDFRGVTKGVRWNGWATPWLPKEEIDRLIPILREGSRDHLDVSPVLEWKEGRLCQTLQDEADEVMESVLVDGVVYYRAGDGYCWEEVEPKEHDE